MKLGKKDYEKYLEIHSSMIYYVGKRDNLLADEVNYEEFMKMSVPEKYEIRNSLYSDLNNFNDYIDANKSTLSKEDIEIIRGFKNLEQGTFRVMKYTKKYTLFFGEKYVYGVLALNDSIDELLGDITPQLVEAVLLPFNDKIIYDGMLSKFPIHIGKGLSKSIKSDFLLSKRKYGIVEQLPFNKVIKIEDDLIAMMKTRSSLNLYWNEIDNLIEDNPELNSIYFRELGRINSKYKKKELNEIGVKNVFYALYNQTLVASGNTKNEAIVRAQKLVTDKSKLESLYLFKT